MQKLRKLTGLFVRIRLTEAEIDKEALFDAMSRGYIAMTDDKYAAYFTPEELKKSAGQ